MLTPRRKLAIAVLTAAACSIGWAVWQWRRTEAILHQAERALADREDAAARDLLAHYLEVRPHAGAARLLAARACRRLRDYDSALEHLRRAKVDGADAEVVEVEYALIGLQQGDAGGVASLRERAGRDDDLALVILEALIEFGIDTYRLRQAQHDVAAYLQRRPDDLLALLKQGYLWERFLSFADAVESYRRAVRAHPNNERARLWLGNALLHAGTPQDALEQFQWLAERAPRRPEVRLGLARCQRLLGRPELALPLLDALLEDAPMYGEALLERGQLALDQGRPAEAETFWRRAYKAMPHDRRVSYGLERCLQQLGRADEAERFRKHVVLLDADLRRLDQVRLEVMQRPDDAALRVEAGILFLRNGERAEGIRWLQLALRLDPNDTSAHAALDQARRGVPP